MAINRLFEGYNGGYIDDSFMSGVHPLRESDPPGFSLGRNPFDERRQLYITYWDACEIAVKLGYPMPEVYEAQLALIDEQARTIADLEASLQSEVHDLQMKAIQKQIQKSSKEILDAHAATLAAVRARLGADGSPADAGNGAKKPVGGGASV
jgi:hypothetical protein